MLPIRKAQAFLWLVAVLFSFGLWHCGSVDQPKEYWVKLELNDSLSLFDSVQVDLVDPADPNRVLQSIASGPLPDPSHMKEVKLLIPASQPYEVRIRAWNEEKELGWESIMIRSGDSNLTFRTVLPPLKPYLVDLASLNPTVGNLEPSFQPTQTTYTLPVSFLTDTLSLTLAAADTRAATVIRRGVDSLGTTFAKLNLSEGSTEVTIGVTNKGNRSQSYKVIIVKPPIPDPRIRTLTPSIGTLNPTFNPEVGRYSLSLPYSGTRLSFSAFVVDTFAVAVVNQDTLRNGRVPNSLSVPVGASTIAIHLFAGSKTMDYAIQVNRADTLIDTANDTTHIPPPPPPPPEPPHLLTLDIKEGKLSPPFNDLVHQYQMLVEDTIAEAHILSLFCDTGITVHIGKDSLACGKTPKPIPLKEGVNTVELQLVDNKTHAYTSYFVTITRKAKFRLAGYANSARIRINTTATGANVLGRVTGYPLLLRLRSTNFNFAEARADGRDIRIVKSDSTIFPSQIESWDSSGGNAAIWVRVDTIPGNSLKDIAYLCWNNPTVVPKATPDTVFRSSDGFAAVWHMDSSFLDATPNQNRGYSRASAAAVPDGLVGSSLKTNGTNQGVDFGNGASISNLTTAIQFEGWVKTTQNSVLANVFRHDWHFTPLQLLSNKGAQSTLHTKFTDTTRANDSLKVLNSEWTGKYDDGAWHQIVAQYESTSGFLVYWDGRVAASQPSLRGPLNTSIKSYMIGISENNADAFNGLTDEVRVQSKVRSADWVKLNFEMIKPNSTAVTFIP